MKVGGILNLPGFLLFNHSGPALGSASLNNRDIPSIIQRAWNFFQPRVHLLLINARNAHPFNTAKEFTGELRCDNNKAPHNPDLDWHPVNKSGPCHPCVV